MGVILKINTNKTITTRLYIKCGFLIISVTNSSSQDFDYIVLKATKPQTWHHEQITDHVQWITHLEMVRLAFLQVADIIATEDLGWVNRIARVTSLCICEVACLAGLHWAL